MKVSAKLKNLRIAPRKVRLVANLIRGLNVEDALNQLDATIKGGINPLKKLLLSAIANGENNFGLDKDNLFVWRAVVNEGPVLKRWMPKAFGRAGRILKRTSQVEIVLEERIEGKGRKTKEQMEKERKEREVKRKKELKEAKEEQATQEEEKSKKEVGKPENEPEKNRPKTAPQGGSWTNRIFRRKSM